MPDQIKTPEPDPYPVSTNRAAIEGCIIGTAIGDSIGLPYEGLSARRAGKLFPGELRQRLIVGKGMCSDDTEHACMTAQSYLQAPQNPEEFAKVLAWKRRFWLFGLPAGIGKATLRSCVKLWLGFSPAKSGVNSAGNGPAMRAPILGVLLGENPQQLKSYVTAATIITHTDSKALDGALLVAFAAHCSATSQGNISPEKFLERIGELRTSGIISSAAENLLLPVIRNHDKDSVLFRTQVLGLQDGVSGYINHTVQMALHIWLKYPKDYQGAVTTSIKCGGDTDTLGAIVGGIVGAATGAEAIPELWKANLWDFPRSKKWMESLARALADKTLVDHSTKLSLNPAALLVRDLVFLIIILAHGFRRLVPPY